LSFSWPASAGQVTVNRFDKNYAPLFTYGYGLNYTSTVQLANDLVETSSDINTTLTTRKIFDRAVKKPWSMRLQSGELTVAVKSNVQTVGALVFKTLDKVVQEDARSVVFDGSATASIKIQSDFPEDLRAFIEEDSALVFNVRIDQKTTANMFLTVVCGLNCDASLNISELFTTLPANQWQEISVDLACFKNLGADFSNIMSPFKLSTNGKASLSFSDISFVPNRSHEALISCSKAN